MLVQAIDRAGRTGKFVERRRARKHPVSKSEVPIYPRCSCRLFLTSPTERRCGKSDRTPVPPRDRLIIHRDVLSSRAFQGGQTTLMTG
jgi:hypothetical protein